MAKSFQYNLLSYRIRQFNGYSSNPRGKKRQSDYTERLTFKTDPVHVKKSQYQQRSKTLHTAAQTSNIHSPLTPKTSGRLSTDPETLCCDLHLL